MREISIKHLVLRKWASLRKCIKTVKVTNLLIFVTIKIDHHYSVHVELLFELRAIQLHDNPLAYRHCFYKEWLWSFLFLFPMLLKVTAGKKYRNSMVENIWYWHFWTYHKYYIYIKIASPKVTVIIFQECITI